MALIRWEPVTELNTIQNEMNRLFNTFFDQPAPPAAAAPPTGGGSRRWTSSRPPTTTFFAPIFPACPTTTSASSSRTTCSPSPASARPSTNSSEEGYYRIERAFGSFARSLTLPDGVDPEGVQAHFDRGVLEIRIPKPEQKKPRHVQIQLGTRPTDDTKTIQSTDTGDPQANSHDPVPAPA